MRADFKLYISFAAKISGPDPPPDFVESKRYTTRIA